MTPQRHRFIPIPKIKYCLTHSHAVVRAIFTVAALTAFTGLQPGRAAPPAVPTAQQLLHGRNIRDLTRPRIEPRPTMRILDATINDYDPQRHEIKLTVHVRDRQTSHPELSVYREDNNVVFGRLYHGPVTADIRGIYDNHLSVNISHLHYQRVDLKIVIDSCSHHAQCVKVFNNPFYYGDLTIHRVYNGEATYGSNGGLHTFRTRITNLGPSPSPVCTVRFRIRGQVVQQSHVQSLAVGHSVTIDYRYGREHRGDPLVVDLPHCNDLITGNDDYSIYLL